MPEPTLLNVMIVEDEALIALDLEMQVETAGHHVVAIAASADQAVERAAAARPDIALMDIRLAGGSSGADAARRLYDRWGIRCLFVSGTLGAELREALAPLRPVALLSKPVSPALLARTLHRHAEERRGA